MPYDMLFIICPLIFIGGVLDAIVGSGALITLPTYLAVGIPAHAAYGTNKFSSFVGSFAGAIKYIKNKAVDWRIIPIFGAFAIIGSHLGARLSLAINETYLKYLLIAALPILIIFLVIKGDFKEKPTENSEISKTRFSILSIIFGLMLGVYGGVLGAGVASFLILALTSIFKISTKSAIGNSRIFNCLIDLTAMINFLISGNVILWIAAPAAVCSILGNIVGASVALKTSEKIMKPLFIIVFAGLFIKLIIDII
ncbi:MAG: sulfite exporter TauE/SafE family protein [Clostridiales bacterium]|jgi:uncharacterized membrane protein YfcA|nr:sulfite exporter TauE/SafE family protein [Clostridiales bacterium]